MSDDGKIERTGPTNQGLRGAQPPDFLSTLRVAIVHYWFVRLRGGERVLEALAGMFPQADIFTLVLDLKALPPSLRSRKFTTSFLQRIPGIRRHYKKFLPLFPLALEQFRLDEYDLVISSESGAAKGILTRPHTCHICYCHTPMRYVWDMYHQYRSSAPGGALGRSFYSIAASYVRQWDYAASARVDYFVASSHNAASRIAKYYRRNAEVIHPPVSIRSFSIGTNSEDFYLVVSPLVVYKRVDLAISACNALNRRLVVIGQGDLTQALRKMAGPTITFLGYQPDEVVRDHYQRCRAFIFPCEDDIGLTPIEAQACGRPVIAFGRGGALETVVGGFPSSSFMPESSTGIFFAEQSAESLAEAIRFFEANENRFSPAFIRRHAERFDVPRFKAEMYAFINAKMLEFKSRQTSDFRLQASDL
jgi:glycosyltransferase involved in cell wall biosynthesis